MRRSSLGKTLAGLTLALFALEAVSQSRDEALASIGDNNDEPSGWMRLEVAIFVDTSDETLASELWEVDPELGYPTNRRWLTDYAEIKALMDEWGEEAVNIDTNGAIAVVPSPPPQPDPNLNPETATSSETDTETTAESEQASPGDRPTFLMGSSNDDLQTSAENVDAIDAVHNGSTEMKIESDGYQEEATHSGLIEQTPNGETATTLVELETEPASSVKNGLVTSIDQQSHPIGSNQVVDNTAVAIERSGVTSQATQPQSQDLGKIPLENLLAVNAEETTPTLRQNRTQSRSMHWRVILLAYKRLSMRRLQTSGQVTQTSQGNAVMEQTSELYENPESFIADDGIVNEAPTETRDDVGNFFAIEGLGERLQWIGKWC